MKTLVEILIDNSNSMGPYEVEKGNKEYLLPDGSTRMELAKTILVEEILPLIDYASKVTVRLFHTETTNNVSTPKIEKIYDTNYDFEVLSQLIKDIPVPKNTGGTPITAAIKESIDALVKYPEDDRKIILVTDGQEDKGGDYKATAQLALKQYGIPCNIFIIGIAQNNEAEEKSKALSTETGGSYIGFKAKIYSKENLQSKLLTLKKVVLSKSIEHSTFTTNPTTVSTDYPLHSIAKPIATLNQPSRQPQNIINEPSTPVISEPDGLTTNNDLAPQDKQFDNIVTDKNEILNGEIINRIEQNTTAIRLISKQLSNISEEIRNMTSKHIEENDDEFETTIIENKELNERVRVASESFLFEKLKIKFGDRVKWLNEQGENGDNHDFEVLDTLDGSIEYYIECKGSLYAEKVFYMTRNEWTLLLKNSKNYQLYFISNALINPEITKIDNFMDWLLRGKAVPFATKNITLKAERIIFTILE